MPQQNPNQRKEATEQDIKMAVTGQTPQQPQEQNPPQQPQAFEQTNTEQMSPSVMSQEQNPPQQPQPQTIAPQQPQQPATQEYQPEQEQNQDYPQEGYDQYPGYEPYDAGGSFDQYPQQYDYQQYQPYQGSVSPDTITEIAEQAITEKLSPIQNKVQDFSKLKTEVETKLSILDERLKRIEKTIDVLQISVLEKVGQHMTNLSDLKHEIIETQKSFKHLKRRTKNPKSKKPISKTKPIK
jgi:hypothetical protein